MHLSKSLLLLTAVLLVIAACSPSSPSPTAPPTSAVTAEPGNTPTPLIAATIEVTAAATPEATSAASDTASTPDSTAEATARAQLYLIREPLPGPACSISPTGGQGVNIRREPGKNSEAIGGLLRGAWALATGLDKSGIWFHISAPGTPVDGGWVTSRNVTIRGVCNCAPGGSCEAG